MPPKIIKSDPNKVTKTEINVIVFAEKFNFKKMYVKYIDTGL